MSPYLPCDRCGAPVKFRDRDLCHACYWRAAREALKQPCPRCGRVRHLRSAGTCAICDRPDVPRPAKTVACRQCGEQRRDSGRGLWNRCKLAEQERIRQAGRRLLSDVTLETRLRILRDLAVHLCASGQITSWTEVTTADLEAFLADRARNRHQDTYVLRRYFAWARQRKLILIDPARPLRLGPQPGFTGTVLDTGTQRTLLSRWSSDGTHPHERLAGLLALLHAASSAEIRGLAAAGADARTRAATLPGRPFPVPADPATWNAVQACLRHHDQLATLNPHLIVTKATRTGTAPADGTYLTRLLAPAGVTPSACRQTRIAQLVNDLDPKLTAAALGMQDSGLVRYLADNVDKDRLQRLGPG